VTVLQILQDSALTVSIFDDIVFGHFSIECHSGPFQFLGGRTLVPVGLEQSRNNLFAFVNWADFS
jgi:hypothetical protein